LTLLKAIAVERNGGDEEVVNNATSSPRDVAENSLSSQ